MDIQLSHYLQHSSHKPKRTIKLPRIQNNNSILSHQSKQSSINHIIFKKMKNIIHESRRSTSQGQFNKKQIKYNNSAQDDTEQKNSNEKRYSHKYMITDNKKNSKTTRKKSWLDKILEHKSDFAKQYFGEIQLTRQKIRQRTFERTFPDIVIGGWTVKGYIYEGFLILKAKNGIYDVSKKFQYQKVQKQINKNYQKWVIQKFKK